MDNENHNQHSTHPTTYTYAKIAVVLAVITAIEVAIFYVDFLSGIFVPLLLALSILKFALVAMFYMHLKFDEPIFVWLFGGGLVLATCVITALMTLFGQF